MNTYTVNRDKEWSSCYRLDLTQHFKKSAICYDTSDINSEVSVKLKKHKEEDTYLVILTMGDVKEFIVCDNLSTLLDVLSKIKVLTDL